MTQIEINGVSKRYRSGLIGSPKKDVLHHIDLTIVKGTIHSLIGLSGSGKTTLGKLSLGMEIPSEGKITSNGEDIFTWRERDYLGFCRNHQMLFQNPFEVFHPYQSIYDSLEEVRYIHAQLFLNAIHLQKTVDVYREQMELEESILYKYPRELSGGQLQRLALLRILLLEPSYIVLDEPTSMLDSISQYKILEILKKYHLEKRITYLLITHDLPIAQHMSDVITVLGEGHIIEQGSTQSLLNDPKSELLQQFIKASSY